MSFGRAAGPILATICGVCTAYAAFAPELQKQAFDKQHETHPSDLSTTQQIQEQEQQPTIISNDESIGRQVKATLAETKAEVMAAEPKAGWFGLGAWKGAFGGAESPREDRAGDGDEKGSTRSA